MSGGKKKTYSSPLDEAVAAAHAAGMRYAEYQVKETLGLAHIKDGKVRHGKPKKRSDKNGNNQRDEKGES